MFGPTKKNPADEKPLTIREQREAEKKAEQRKKVNIFLSRSGGGEQGSSGYQTSRSAFAGGEVESRSRVSFIGNFEGKSKESAFGKAVAGAGFAKGSSGKVNTGMAQNKNRLPSSGSAGLKSPSRPLGF